MPAKKKIADLPKKTLKAKKADSVKGGRLRAHGRLKASKKASGPGNWGSGN